MEIYQQKKTQKNKWHTWCSVISRIRGFRSRTHVILFSKYVIFPNSDPCWACGWMNKVGITSWNAVMKNERARGFVKLISESVMDNGQLISEADVTDVSFRMRCRWLHECHSARASVDRFSPQGLWLLMAVMMDLCRLTLGGNWVNVSPGSALTRLACRSVSVNESAGSIPSQSPVTAATEH